MCEKEENKIVWKFLAQASEEVVVSPSHIP